MAVFYVFLYLCCVFSALAYLRRKQDQAETALAGACNASIFLVLSFLISSFSFLGLLLLVLWVGTPFFTVLFSLSSPFLYCMALSDAMQAWVLLGLLPPSLMRRLQFPYILPPLVLLEDTNAACSVTEECSFTVEACASVL